MNMSDKDIKRMLQKYMDGMTSIEEEARLTAYFSKAGDKVAPEGFDEEDWQAYKEMFAMFAPRQRKSVRLWRYAVAVVLVLVVAGGMMWFRHPTTPPIVVGGQIAMTDKSDTTTTEIIADTMATDIIKPQQKVLPSPKKEKKRRYEPVVPRHYMAQTAPPEAEEIDPEEAIRQADLLMQAVYLQQQSDLNNALLQCTLIIEEEEEAF